jgi:exopolysaccharide biosynthesis polyprenyl glycosylphosphotransferase
VSVHTAAPATPAPDGTGTFRRLEDRPRPRARGRRGWLMRRLLLLADVIGLSAAFAVVEILFGSHGQPDAFGLDSELALFFVALPIFVLGAKLFGLYDRDEERADHSTSDELARVFLLATVGVFLVSRLAALGSGHEPDLTKMTLFWILLIVCIACGRMVVRALARRSVAYVQNTVILGAGDVGQLVGRKLLQHREYGIRVLGFVDDRPKERRPDLGDLTILGTVGELPTIVREQAVDRVIVAFSNERHEQLVPIVRVLRDLDVQVDIVPRLFDVIGPRVHMHTVEGLPLVGLSPVRIPRSSRLIKRALDVVGAFGGLVLATPLLGVIGLAIKLDSPGPVFFRQLRLGKDMREFTMLKFRTMCVDADESTHRAYIAETAGQTSPVLENGLFKLERPGEITRVGRWLRRTSLDELPQLVNVLKGEMSLVGPRPCLAYELDHFQPHHFDRFLVPAGVTGLWQVSARARSTFGEALELDVLYAHSWSLGLDLSLLARTPLQLLRPAGTA